MRDAVAGSRQVGRTSEEIRSARMTGRIGLLVHAKRGPGVLHAITGAIASHSGDIVSVDILETGPVQTRVYFEIDMPDTAAGLVDDVARLPMVHSAEKSKSMGQIYGKR